MEPKPLTLSIPPITSHDESAHVTATHTEANTGLPWLVMGIVAVVVAALIAIGLYYTANLARETSRLSQSNDAITQQVAGQAARLQQFETTDQEVRQSIAETNARDARIEKRLSQIEDDHMALKRANAHIMRQLSKVEHSIERSN